MFFVCSKYIVCKNFLFLIMSEENKCLRLEALQRRARRSGLSLEEFKRVNIQENKRLKELSIQRKEIKNKNNKGSIVIHSPPGGLSF